MTKNNLVNWIALHTHTLFVLSSLHLTYILHLPSKIDHDISILGTKKKGENVIIPRILWHLPSNVMRRLGVLAWLEY